MFSLHGSGVGKGIAIGQAFVLRQDHISVPEFSVDSKNINHEVKRFKLAIKASKKELKKLKKELPSSTPDELVLFIDAHLLMIKDPMLSQQPIKLIQDQRINAEQALDIQRRKLSSVFEDMQDAYLGDKRQDINQVVGRIMEHLMDVHEQTQDQIAEGLVNKIVVARDLSPADTVVFKHHKMSAFITDLGGPISHTAILARGLGVPAIVGLHGASRYIRNNDMIIIDGKRGVILVNPDDATLEAYRQYKNNIKALRLELEQLRSTIPITLDNQPINLLANIELPSDIDIAQQYCADGVGLYRTEYLYMNREQAPSESEQYKAYSKAAKTLSKPVTIRTLDLGADKQANNKNNEVRQNNTNPAMGLRAIRLSLHDPHLFRPQLRAILRASCHGKIELMIPMLSALDELQQVLALIQEIKDELIKEDLSFDHNIAIGGMIEVPAAAVSADIFAEQLDFLSIGTNDLIQYTLAIDRVDDAVNYLYDPLHPSVLRLIKQTIDAGIEANIPVSMCGEMAGDTRYTRLLLGMGLRHFSMDPHALLEVKKIIIESNISVLIESTKAILSTNDPESIRRQVAEL